MAEPVLVGRVVAGLLSSGTTSGADRDSREAGEDPTAPARADRDAAASDTAPGASLWNTEDGVSSGV